VARQIPTQVQHSTGDLVTGRVWNSGPKALNDFLSNRPSFLGARGASFQSVANNTWTAVVWLAGLLDTDSGYSSAVNSSRYTCQVAGWYWVKGAVAWDGSGVSGASGAGRIDTAVAKNGTIVVGSSQFLTRANLVNSGQQASALVQLAVGDYVELWVRQITGATQYLYSAYDTLNGLHVLWVHS
jgi:hypothetical protein